MRVFLRRLENGLYQIDPVTFRSPYGP